MTSETQQPDPFHLPKLPLYHHHEPPSGMQTPPLQTTTATVPFRWEEQPGKPRPCTDMVVAQPSKPDIKKCLELPPRLIIIEPNINTKTSSPTTVLDGPSDFGGKSVFSSSFSFSKERRRFKERRRSFDSSFSGGPWSPVEDHDGCQHVMLLGGGAGGGGGGKGIFGSFRLKGSSKVKGSLVIAPLSTMDAGFFVEKKGKRLRGNSCLSKARSHFWATLYEGIKQAVPWRKKPKKESFTF